MERELGTGLLSVEGTQASGAGGRSPQGASARSGPGGCPAERPGLVPRASALTLRPDMETAYFGCGVPGPLRTGSGPSPEGGPWQAGPVESQGLRS